MAGLRRRTFTQGGVDALLDLHTTREVCSRFVTHTLGTTREECEAAFAGLVAEMAALAKDENKDDDDGSGEEAEGEEGLEEGANVNWEQGILLTY